MPYEAGKTVAEVAKEGGKEGGSGKSGICPFNEVLARSLAGDREGDGDRATSVQRVLAVPCKVFSARTVTKLDPYWQWMK